ncbi:DEAD/DEAH box helicase [Streptomyces sp. NPDC086787]|uniref:DEAD/DEAH box helicase n=1 Tax=Streptomyces sp. NPDC086787 TaxID=3365759 RepID=UPI0038265D0C
MTLPVALSGSDVIGQAKTGTGKTLGFGLPILERVVVPADVEAGRARPEAVTDTPQALVVVPTRELCTQVTNDLLTAGKVRNVRVTAIYGGRAYEPQVEALKKGVDVIVGTPGRLLDLAGQKKLDLRHVKCLVLDEADEMLDLGFLPDVEKIINMLPAKRQTMLFSATMPGAVIGLARRYMSQPTHIRATAPDDEGATVANIKQFVYRAHSMDKPEMIARILQADGRGLAMIFCRTKRTAADIAEQLQRRGFASGAVHGDLGQGAREQALRAFRNGKVDVLVCTDVAARGIDVEGVTHVINYQSPEDEKTYLHRVGRTGRAGAKGTAITFVDWDDIPRWQLINKALELGFSDPVETYSTSPHFFEDLSIPAGTKGVLPRSERTRAGLAAEELEDLGETGGRGARGRGGRGGSGDSRPAESERAERTARAPRNRRRTRGGTPLEDAAAGTAATEEPTSARTPRRRRRTRGRSSDGQAVATVEAVATEATVTEAAQAAVTAVEGPAVLDAPEAVDTPEKPRRRRTRKTAERAETPAKGTESTPEAVAPAVEAPPVVEAAPVVVETPDVVEETKPRRRTRKAATAAETVADTAEGTEAKPAARRTRKTAVTAPEAVAEAEAAPAKPRRTRKTAAAAPEATAEVSEAAEAAPRRRTRKAATASEAVVDTAEATEAKPATRRTRKTAVTAPEAEVAAVAEAAPAKPRRTRKTAAAAAEAAVDTAEATEAKPATRRTRKTAVAAPEAEVAAVAEAAPAKPRRTRKTAATATVAEIPAQAAEEPEATPRRRTRKAATATAEVAGETAEAKPKARRTRKATAAVEAPEA